MNKSLFLRILDAYEKGSPLQLSAGDVGTLRKFVRDSDCYTESGWDARIAHGGQKLEQDQRNSRSHD